jgi:signal transduction histidine kinase
MFRNSIEYNGTVYSSYLRIRGHPYTILVGYKKAVSAQEFEETVLPGIIWYSFIGIISIILLLIIRKQIVGPVIRLSAIADKISKGEEVKRIRGGRTYEINNLALQLIKVRNSLQREQKIKEEQKELLKIIRESDNEKEIFLRELYHAMNNPLNIVIAGAELLKTKQFGNNLDNYIAYLEMIYSAGRQLESYTTDIINPSQMDVKEVIERCVVLQKKKATEIRLNIEVDLPNNIPPIMADELRIRQVIISILGQALFCIQDFGTIKVSAQVKSAKNGKPSILIITIEDDGLGISEKQRIEQWEQAFGNPDKIHAYSRNPDVTRMSFPIIRHLIKLHQGSFELKTTSGVGSTFIITLPYLSKKELETAPKSISQDSTKKFNLDEKSAANIITFPGA